MKTKAEELVAEFVEKSKTTPGQHTVFELADLAYQSGILAGLEDSAEFLEIYGANLYQGNEQNKFLRKELYDRAKEIRAKAKEVREGKA